MAGFNGAVLTNVGRDMLAQSQAGATLTLTKVATGNGIYADKSPAALQVRTALKSQKQEFPLVSKTVHGDKVEASTVISNEELETSYYMNEIGLFGKIGNGEEQLFSIAVVGVDNSILWEAYNGETPITMTQTFVITTSNTSTIEVIIPSDAYASAEDFNNHVAETAKSEYGAHGIRYYQGTLSVYDPIEETWDEIRTGGGGSEVKVITEDDTLFGGTVTVTDGGYTYTGTMSAQGECTLDAVEIIGTASITVENGGATATDALSIPYFGKYEVEVATGVINTISLSTTETTLYGQTITASYGGHTKTAVFSNSGAASMKIIDYTGAVTFTATDGEETATSNLTITAGTTEYSVAMAFIYIYGASWDGTSTTAWTRTDGAADFIDPVPAVSNGTGSSPFDAISPWKDMVKVEDTTGGTLVAIPKFYYKITQNGNGLKVQVSASEFDGARVSPAHMNRGDGAGERDIVYIGRYKCGSNYKSTTGVTPVVNITRSAARTSIHNLGSAYWQADFAIRFTIWLLYIVEFADWNSQNKIGYGCAPTGSTSAVRTMGYTDAMQYHTGTDQASRTTYGGTQYRNIEGLWDNCYDWCDGAYYDSNGMNIILNPNSFSDSSGGVSIGTPSSGYPSKFTLKDVANTFLTFIPTEASGSDLTYSCDYWYFNASYPCLFVGGSYGQDLNHGLFYVYCASATNASAVLGCRLLKLP